MLGLHSQNDSSLQLLQLVDNKVGSPHNENDKTMHISKISFAPVYNHFDP